MQHNSLLNNHQPDIGVLLEKYFDGETTLDEEKILKVYFNTPGVAPEHQAMAPLFQMLSKEKAALMPKKGKTAIHDLSSQRSMGSHWPKFMAAAATMLLLITAAAWWWGTRPTTLVTKQPIATVPLQDDKTPSKDGMLATNKDLPLVQIKVQTSYAKPLVNRKRESRVRKQTQPVLASQIDPETEEAMEEIKAAFQLISAKINKGRKEAAKGLKEIEHMDKGIEKIKVNS